MGGDDVEDVALRQVAIPLQAMADLRRLNAERDLAEGLLRNFVAGLVGGLGEDMRLLAGVDADEGFLVFNVPASDDDQADGGTTAPVPLHPAPPTLDAGAAAVAPAGQEAR